MKIALLTDGIQPYVMGGMQKHSFCLAKYLASHRIFVDLYHTPLFGKRTSEMELLSCFTENEKKYIRGFLIDFPKFIPLPGHYLRESYRHSCLVYDLFSNNGPVDFIYAKGFTSWKLVEEKIKGKKIPPLGVKFHGYEMFQKSTSLYEKINRFAFLQSPVKFISQNADFVFSYGGKITELIRSLNVQFKNIIEIPSAVEADWLIQSAPIVKKPRKFIFVGRFERRKGIEELSQAINKCEKWASENREKDAGNEFQFHFVGPIPQRKRIVSSYVHYSGPISNSEKMKRLLSDSDLLVCPSYSEGMPNVILEAMSRGLAIIATDVGAVNCLVNSENGILLKNCSVKNIHEAIIEAILLPEEKLLQMKINSIKKTDEYFIWEKVIQQLIFELKRITGK